MTAHQTIYPLSPSLPPRESRKLNRPLFVYNSYNSPVLNANLSTPRGYGVYGTALAWLWPRPRANLYRNHQNVTTSGKRCWRPAEGEGTSLKFTLNIHRDRARWQEADGTEIGAFLIELMRYWKLVEVFSSCLSFPPFVRLPYNLTFSRGSIKKNSHFSSKYILWHRYQKNDIYLSKGNKSVFTVLNYQWIFMK